MRTIITYGTFDLFHVGHVRLLQRLKELGDRLIVGVSTDEFNTVKGKRSFMPYHDRAEIVGAVRWVDAVIPESSWEQKTTDIREHSVSVFGIGDDWAGKFDYLREYCEVVYIPRTKDISSTALRTLAGVFDREMVNKLSEAHSILADLLGQFRGR